MDARKHSMYIYGTRSSGLTGNQLKLIGIAAVLIDNLGAVVIQGVILRGGESGALSDGGCRGWPYVDDCRAGVPLCGSSRFSDFGISYSGGICPREGPAGIRGPYAGGRSDFRGAL